MISEGIRIPMEHSLYLYGNIISSPILNIDLVYIRGEIKEFYWSILWPFENHLCRLHGQHKKIKHLLLLLLLCDWASSKEYIGLQTGIGWHNCFLNGTWISCMVPSPGINQNESYITFW